ncbi:ADP-ribosylglycohydrolase family protein [Cellulomonas endophytica]|uniref:ADP-ribosylglycohydrolase family protein n=1 Tax=Cellulomonas endophytica TaxID=2494735 RepID=UPI0010116932|nr:ADP-ribosylglycohydrolase family protein [Cellulomonas endophytica]
MRLTWAQPEDLLAHELVQAADEGVDVAAVRDRWVAAGGDPVPAVSGAGPVPAPPALRVLARALLDELTDLRFAAPGAGAEPTEWDDLVAVLPPAPVLPPPPGRAALEARLLGAWTGRAAGCLLGKPVEKIPRQGIEEILRATGRWPLDRYLTAVGLPDEVAARWPWNRRSAPTSLEEVVDGMPEDDDLNYPLLALDLLERHGSALTTDDVATAWLDALPAGRVFTAERAALRNLLDARDVPATATHHNPFRWWIGALIRADVHGWAHPGDVRAAARSALVDARLSHTGPGAQGAAWAAALCAASLVLDDVEDVLDAAGAVLPPGGRLAAAVALGRRAGASGGDLSAGLDTLHAALGRHHWVHVLPNAATVAFALAHGRGRFTPSVSAAVTAGWDTDSVGATVGSVVGALRGLDGIEERWWRPLRGEVATSLPGPPTRSFADLAARTALLSAATGRVGA